MILRTALLALALSTSAALATEARLLSRFEWRVPEEPWFGGLSGLILSEDGSRITALSDRAWLFEGKISRDEGGAILGISLTSARPLLDQTGAPLIHPRADSEDLALSPDGQLHIAFEGDARIRREGGKGDLPEVLPRHAPFADLPSNTSLEALAFDKEGALYTIPEGAQDGQFHVYRLQDGLWSTAFLLAQEGESWRVSGADIGPDGRLYVLERSFLGIGFRSRVRRMDLAGQNIETMLLSGLNQFGNLEGISVWHAEDGLRMSLISDDNYTQLLPSQIVEYRLVD